MIYIIDQKNTYSIIEKENKITNTKYYNTNNTKFSDYHLCCYIFQLKEKIRKNFSKEKQSNIILNLTYFK